MVRHLYLNRNIACMIVISLIANMSGSMILPLFAIYVEQFGISVLGILLQFDFGVDCYGYPICHSIQVEIYKKKATCLSKWPPFFLTAPTQLQPQNDPIQLVQFSRSVQRLRIEPVQPYWRR